jgi:hypothetical protein
MHPATPAPSRHKARRLATQAQEESREFVSIEASKHPTEGFWVFPADPPEIGVLFQPDRLSCSDEGEKQGEIGIR